MKTSLEVAKNAGFCFGVRRAIELVQEHINSGEKVCTLGPLIHNRQVTDDLERKGVTIIEDPLENIEKRRVIIRSHGVTLNVYAQLDRMGVPYTDATCPFVRKIHNIAQNANYNDTLVIMGDSTHPEVTGIAGNCSGKVLVASNSSQLREILKGLENEENDIFLVAQTTFPSDEWKYCVELAKKEYTKAIIFDTICNATSVRQQEAAQLASKSDLMVVIGGRHSSNTSKLTRICEQFCRTLTIEVAEELRVESFQGLSSIGITAGASTPAWIIKEVHETMSEMLEKQNQEELSFEEMLDQSFKSTYNGEKVTAVVTGIAPNEISVDIGTKHAGYVPMSELTDDISAKPEDIVKKGDEIELLVVRVNDVEGTVMLSKKRLDAQAGFEKVMNAAGTDEVLDGIVVEAIKGGVLVLTNGVKVFVPASQATMSRGEDLNNLIRKSVQLKILEVNRQRRRAVGSVRAVALEKRKELEAGFWSDVVVDKKYTGTVKSLTDYGAFIDLGGVDGMVHISEMSWSKVRHPSQVFNVGDEVEVFVKSVDPEKKKISLGYKKDEDNPWSILEKNYSVGQVVNAKIVSLTAFGAFAEIIPGIDGLIHISQMSNERVVKPADILSVGQEVEVKITEMDLERRRISLSMKALLPEVAAESTEQDTLATPAAPEKVVEEEAQLETDLGVAPPEYGKKTDEVKGEE